MHLPVQAVRWVDDEPQPGIVEVRFTDAHGIERILLDKCVVFDPDNVLRPDATYPMNLEIPIEVVGTQGDVAVIALPWGLSDGQSEPIEVFSSSLIERA